MHQYHVSDFGAKGDGKTLDTVSLQRTLDVAAGGGYVVFDPGIYITGSLFVKSHTHLIIGKGIRILGTQDTSAYPKIKTRAAGIEMGWPAALINVHGQTDVSIEGEGTIDGNGKSWWDLFWSKVPAYEARGLRWAADYDVQRPELIQVYKSTNVRLGGGLQLRRSAFWTVHICYSSHIVVDRLTIRDEPGPSTDGVDIDSSSHVLVQRVDISNNDDGICLKAGMNADGLRVNRPTEDVVIRNSIIRKGISGIALGSDTAGGFNHIRVSDIRVLGGVYYGIYFKSTHTRGGWTKDVRIDGVSMDGVKIGIMVDPNYFPAFSTPHIPAGIQRNLPPWLSSIPDYWHILAEPVSPGKGIPHFRDVTFAHIRGQDVGTAIRLSGYPNAPLEHFTLKNVFMDAEHAGQIKHALDLRLENVNIQARDGKPLSFEDMRQTTGTIEQSK